MNVTNLIGRMTKDPVLRKTGSGASVTSFNLAVDRDFKREGQPTADFFSIVTWNKVADNVANYCHKGSLVGITGRLQQRTYEDDKKQQHNVVEVVADKVQFLDTKNNKESQNDYQSGYQNDYQNNYQNYQDTQTDGTLDIPSDDLPF